MLVRSLLRSPKAASVLAAGTAGLLVALAGCATSRPAPPVVAPAAVVGSDVRCTVEKPTGSMLPVKVCTTKAQRDQIDASAREARDQMQRAHSPACPGTQGCAVK
jgi:hypothetical protein